jgi:hypothetical protein
VENNFLQICILYSGRLHALLPREGPCARCRQTPNSTQRNSTPAQLFLTFTSSPVAVAANNWPRKAEPQGSDKVAAAAAAVEAATTASASPSAAAAHHMPADTGPVPASAFGTAAALAPVPAKLESAAAPFPAVAGSVLVALAAFAAGIVARLELELQRREFVVARLLVARQHCCDLPSPLPDLARVLLHVPRVLVVQLAACSHSSPG